MRKRQSITEARKKLPQLVREVESGEPIELTRRGESVAVLIGQAQDERPAARSRRFSEAWNEFTRDVSLAALAIDPGEVFNGLRGHSAGQGHRVVT